MLYEVITQNEVDAADRPLAETALAVGEIPLPHAHELVRITQPSDLAQAAQA